MSLANLKTLEIFKKAKLRKDDGGAPTGGAITTADLAAGGGLMVPEQGGRRKKYQNLNRKMRKPVRLGKTVSELVVEKAKDAKGHGSEKHGDNASRYTSASQLAASETRRATGISEQAGGGGDMKNLEAASAHEYAAKAHRLAAEVAGDAGMAAVRNHVEAAQYHDKQEKLHQDRFNEPDKRGGGIDMAAWQNEADELKAGKMSEAEYERRRAKE